MDTSLVNVVVGIAVAVLIIARQFSTRKYAGPGANPRKFLVLPIVLVVLAVSEKGLVDKAHQGASIALLVAGVVVEAALACAWGFTTKVWRESDGSVYGKGTPAAIGVWLVMIAARLGLYALGAAMGVHSGSGALLVSVAALLLVRNGVVMWRARELEPTYRVSAAG
ncbi:hypothetical protein [Phaeacidiphilus oryzae]|jgi:hypothetical protein|uniref:hypothetical protein n=1 Tax=Phaeacidiphilus oryzae TaxID=348818 RepID=UPI00056B4C25|nr:hypothetical protein [Phaeacidiphilus oryzae]